jgi:uncharacterized protein
MKIIIAGGTGQVGTILAKHFHARGDEVVVLGRSKRQLPWKTAVWDGETLGSWSQELINSDVVINLAGKSVNCRYNWKNRWKILESRMRSVRVLGKVISELESPPKVWLQASSATIYTHRFDAANDEKNGLLDLATDQPDTWKFSIDIVRAWEGELELANTPKTRKIAMRMSMVMSPDEGGVFDYLLWLVKIGLGGNAGSGKQFVSWIHYLDFVKAVDFLIAREDISGAINVASPNPIPNSEFMKGIRSAWGRKFGLPAFEWMLEIGAIFLKTETELVLKSRRVVPGRLLESGFSFDYGNWEHAAKNLCKSKRLEAREDAGSH